MKTVRIFFSKTGTSAYISHLDLQRVMARALRTSGMPVWYSQGFNPHIYMSFALPLPLGHQSLCECVDVKTESEEDLSVYVEPLCNALPKGIQALRITPAQPPADSITHAVYHIEYPSMYHLNKIAQKYKELPEAVVERKTKRTSAPFDLKSVLPTLELKDAHTISAVLPAGSKLNLNPALLTGFLQQAFELPAEAANITRQSILAGESVFA